MRHLRSKSLFLFAALATLFTAAAKVGAAPVEALNFENGGGYYALTNNLITNYSVGWKFTVNNPILVSSLGYFDGGTVGLNEGHSVGLFTDTGTPLTSTTVVTGDPLVASSGSQPGNGFRYQPITPYYLAPGNYVIGGQIGTLATDDFWVQATATTTPSAVSYTGGVYASGAALPFPNNPADQGVSYFGPNFQFDTFSNGISVNLDASQGAVGANLAGVVSLPNWNDVPGLGATTPLNNSSGAASGLSISVPTEPGVATTGSGANFPGQPGNTAMMTGHVYNGNAAGTLDLNFTGSVPFDVFDLYVYYNSGAVTSTQTFELLNSSLVPVAASQVGFDIAGTDSSFVLSTGGNDANYIRFSGLTSAQLGANFVIRSTHTGGNYSYFNGLQFVQVPVPEPSCAVLALCGMVGMAAFRRRRV